MVTFHRMRQFHERENTEVSPEEEERKGNDGVSAYHDNTTTTDTKKHAA